MSQKVVKQVIVYEEEEEEDDEEGSDWKVGSSSEESEEEVIVVTKRIIKPPPNKQQNPLEKKIPEDAVINKMESTEETVKKTETTVSKENDSITNGSVDNKKIVNGDVKKVDTKPSDIEKNEKKGSEKKNEISTKTKLSVEKDAKPNEPSPDTTKPSSKQLEKVEESNIKDKSTKNVTDKKEEKISKIITEKKTNSEEKTKKDEKLKIKDEKLEIKDEKLEIKDEPPITDAKTDAEKPPITTATKVKKVKKTKSENDSSGLEGEENTKKKKATKKKTETEKDDDSASVSSASEKKVKKVKKKSTEDKDEKNSDNNETKAKTLKKKNNESDTSTTEEKKKNKKKEIKKEDGLEENEKPKKKKVKDGEDVKKKNKEKTLKLEPAVAMSLDEEASVDDTKRDQKKEEIFSKNDQNVEIKKEDKNLVVEDSQKEVVKTTTNEMDNGTKLEKKLERDDKVILNVKNEAVILDKNVVKEDDNKIDRKMIDEKQNKIEQVVKLNEEKVEAIPKQEKTSVKILDEKVLSKIKDEHDEISTKKDIEITEELPSKLDTEEIKKSIHTPTVETSEIINKNEVSEKVSINKTSKNSYIDKTNENIDEEKKVNVKDEEMKKSLSPFEDVDEDLLKKYITDNVSETGNDNIRIKNDFEMVLSKDNKEKKDKILDVFEDEKNVDKKKTTNFESENVKLNAENGLPNSIEKIKNVRTSEENVQKEETVPKTSNTAEESDEFNDNIDDWMKSILARHKINSDFLNFDNSDNIEKNDEAKSEKTDQNEEKVDFSTKPKDETTSHTKYTANGHSQNDFDDYDDEKNDIESINKQKSISKYRNISKKSDNIEDKKSFLNQKYDNSDDEVEAISKYLAKRYDDQSDSVVNKTEKKLRKYSKEEKSRKFANDEEIDENEGTTTKHKSRSMMKERLEIDDIEADEGFMARFRREKQDRINSRENNYLRHSDETNEKMKEKSREIKSLVEKQQNVMENLKTACKKINELENMLRECKAEIMEQQSNMENLEDILNAIYKQYENECTVAAKQLSEYKKPKSDDIKDEINNVLSEIRIYTKPVSQKSYYNGNSFDDYERNTSNSRASWGGLWDSVSGVSKNKNSNEDFTVTKSKRVSFAGETSNLSELINDVKNGEIEENTRGNSSTDDFINKIRSKYSLPAPDVSKKYTSLYNNPSSRNSLSDFSLLESKYRRSITDTSDSIRNKYKSNKNTDDIVSKYTSINKFDDNSYTSPKLYMSSSSYTPQKYSNYSFSSKTSTQPSYQSKFLKAAQSYM